MLLTARCPVCHRPDGAPCAECAELFVPVGPLAPPPGLDGLVAAFSYEDAARPLVTSLKYRDQRAVVPWIAAQMAEVLAASPTPACITWAPTSRSRRRARGFDQAELLARAVARRAGLPARRLLVRRDGVPQTGRAATARRQDPARFAAIGRVPHRVIVVDDVVTTGSTLSAAARALRARGASRVTGLVAAATPAPGAGSR